MHLLQKQEEMEEEEEKQRRGVMLKMWSTK
jgi:hypothetical protein